MYLMRRLGHPMEVSMLLCCINRRKIRSKIPAQDQGRKSGMYDMLRRRRCCCLLLNGEEEEDYVVTYVRDVSKGLDDRCHGVASINLNTRRRRSSHEESGSKDRC